MMSEILFYKACGALQKLAIHGASECAKEKIPAPAELQDAINFLLEHYTVENSFAGSLFIEVLKAAQEPT
jgi:hypothetical protein